jgi:rhodanese-related sulfurtransferase
VREGGRVVKQALALGALAVLAAAVLHWPLIKRFARGEFRETFFQAAEHPGVRLITLEETEDLWRAGSVFVDARKDAEFRDGHVPGALSAPAAQSEKAIPEAVQALARDRALIIYCEGGDCQSSLLLADRMSQEGFKDIRVFTGGWAGWTAADLPVEKTEKTGLGEKGDGQE